MDIVTLDRYQLEALRTASDLSDPTLRLATLGLGIAGEGGEIADIVKKFVAHGHALDRDKVVEEIGDALWYLANLADAVGASLSEVATANITKLKRRYPDGFSQERSINRDEQLELGL